MESKSEELLEAWGAFFVAHALSIRQIEESLQGRTPLTLDEYDVLLGISRAWGGKIRFSELASATVFTRSGITRVAKRLQSRGFLERRVCPEDKRGAYAVLTPKGTAAMRETWKHYSKAIISLFTPCFSHADAKLFKSHLERIVAEIRKSPLVQITRRRQKS